MTTITANVIPGRFELVDDANISDKIISTWRLKEDLEK